MSAPAKRLQLGSAPAPIDTVRERAEARALLWSLGDIETVPDAVDELAMFAATAGIDTDVAQQIMADAILPYREAEWAAEREIAEQEAAALRHFAGSRVKDDKPRPTPQVVIEAIMWCVRERGRGVLLEPGNVERLSRCDAAAVAEIEQRIAKLRGADADS